MQLGIISEKILRKTEQLRAKRKKRTREKSSDMSGTSTGGDTCTEAASARDVVMTSPGATVVGDKKTTAAYLAPSPELPRSWVPNPADAFSRNGFADTIAAIFNKIMRQQPYVTYSGVRNPFETPEGKMPSVSFRDYLLRVWDNLILPKIAESDFAADVMGHLCVGIAAIVDVAYANTGGLVRLTPTSMHRVFACCYYFWEHFWCDHVYTCRFYARVFGLQENVFRFLIGTMGLSLNWYVPFHAVCTMDDLLRRLNILYLPAVSGGF